MVLFSAEDFSRYMLWLRPERWFADMVASWWCRHRYCMVIQRLVPLFCCCHFGGAVLFVVFMSLRCLVVFLFVSFLFQDSPHKGTISRYEINIALIRTTLAQTSQVCLLHLKVQPQIAWWPMI